MQARFMEGLEKLVIITFPQLLICSVMAVCIFFLHPVNHFARRVFIPSNLPEST